MDPLLSTIQYALGGLQLRLDTSSHNIANVNTPNFRAQQVVFEQDLAQALTQGRATPNGAPRVVAGDAPIGDGMSSVSLETELTELAKNAVTRQTLISGFNYKMEIMRSSMGTR
jgi:flagellar basal-body rod protein FlgB